MRDKIKYEFSSSMWKDASPGGWYFVSLPINISKEIRSNLQWQEEGWGRMKANVQIESLKWETAIWFDTKADTYLLPIKAAIRKKLNLEVNQQLKVAIWL